ncbi:hypothetical protein RN001_002950 [Aquatica leii]|uniref:YqaJ viral recombinase domain-containing protein n=1 Tax=Aquatica leii TaxID=1421715 RepID=A0AAN7SM26_9COLE|nr:hypothetical protein RN001_002950 [Aquatica leii]
MHESVAITMFEESQNLKVQQSGFFIDLDFPFFGASPDGLIGDNELIEVKCLFKVAKLSIALEEAAKTIPTLFGKY